MPKNKGIHGEGYGTGLPNDGDYSDTELRALPYLARMNKIINSMPTTGDCLNKDCNGSYDAFGRCHLCGSVD